MPFSISGFDASGMRRRFASTVLAILGSMSLVGLPGSGAVCEAAEWTVTPRLSMSGGTESDLVLDPDLTRSAVPGGRYVNLSPNIYARGRLSPSTEVRASANAALERFLNSDDRLLYAQSLHGELVHWNNSGLRSRVAASGSYFDDSERQSVRRVGGGIESGLGIVRRDWTLEAVGGVGGRRYPELVSGDDLGSPGTYTEANWRLGLNGALRIGDLLLRPGVGYRSTDARDPLFDSDAYDLSLRARWTVNERTGVSVVALAQSRSFSRRLATDDHDEYVQGGVGVDHRLSPAAELVVRFSLARYTRTTGEDEDSHRLEAGLRYAFGSHASRRSSADVDMAQLRKRFVPQHPDVHHGGAQLRIFAPEATSVHVAGDFNRWSRTQNSLTRDPDGWWTIDLDLPPGLYQYRFFVDGVWLTPSDTDAVIDDGFGGKNAVLEVFGDSL